MEDFDDDAWLEDVTNELDSRWGMEDDQSLVDELGYEEVTPSSSAHSKRSRDMLRGVV